MLQPTKEVDYREAEKTLRAYLKEHGYSVSKTPLSPGSWNRWEYSNSPFWSTVCMVYINLNLKMIGFHIHDNGEVIEIELQSNFNQE
jgi:hypothetical protein